MMPVESHPLDAKYELRLKMSSQTASVGNLAVADLIGIIVCSRSGSSNATCGKAVTSAPIGTWEIVISVTQGNSRRSWTTKQQLHRLS